MAVTAIGCQHEDHPPDHQPTLRQTANESASVATPRAEMATAAETIAGVEAAEESGIETPDSEAVTESRLGPRAGIESEPIEAPLPSDAAAPAESAATRPARERIIDFFTIGGGSTNEARRQVGFVTEAGGWPQFIQTHVRPNYDWGVRRIWLHCPFGNTPNTRFDFDQYVLAEEAGLRWLTDRFTESWQPIVAGAFGEPVEVVCYIGTVMAPRGERPPRDIEFNRLRRDGRADEWLDRAMRSVRPALAAGMSIGFDAAADQPDQPPHNWSFAFASLLRSLGVQVYIEPRPQRALPGWHDFDLLVVDTFWRRSDPARHRDSAWAATNEQLTGEVIRLVIVRPGVEGNRERTDEVAERVRSILRDGHSVAVPIRVLRLGGWTMERLLEGLDEPTRDLTGGAPQ